MSNSTLATVVSCMDGRIQDPLRSFAVYKFQVSFVDSITDRGGLLRHLADPENKEYAENMIQNIKVSLQAHNSKGVVLAGHQKCAGYQLSDDEKRKEIQKAAEHIKEKFPGVEVVPVFVVQDEPQ